MKPLGMSPAFEIIRPTRVEDKIYAGVEEAFEAGWTPQQVLQEVRECWRICSDEKRKSDDRAFSKITGF